MDRLIDALSAAGETPLRGNPGSDESLGTAKQVKRHFGDVSDMWLWRRLNEDPTFPRPLVIRRRRFWRWSELRAWEARHAT